MMLKTGASILWVATPRFWAGVAGSR